MRKRRRRRRRQRVRGKRRNAAGLKKNVYIYIYRAPIAGGLCNQGVFCAMSAKSVYDSTMSLTPLFYLFKKKNIYIQPNEALVSFLIFHPYFYIACLAALLNFFQIYFSAHNILLRIVQRERTRELYDQRVSRIKI